MPAWFRDAIWADRSRVHVSKRYGGNELPSQMIALEPRVMLDGAVAIAAVDQADQADNAPAQEDGKTAETAALGQNTESDGGSENSGSDQESGIGGGEAGRTVVIVDASIQDPAELLAGIDPSAEIYYLNSGTDGIQQVTAILSGLSNVTSLQILSHGATGSITLGTTILNAANIESYTAEFVTWDTAIADGGDILLYGCNVAEDRSGLQFIDHFSDLTGADVAASIDVTGATELGGNWTLESEVGAIESGVVLAAEAMDGYRHVLMAPVNTAPTLTGLNGLPNFIEDGVPVIIDGDVTVGDAEQNWDGGALTVSGLAAADNVAVRTVGNAAGQTSVSGADISVGGTIVATFAGGTSGTTLVVTFNASAANADVEAVIENLTFSNGSDTPTASRALQFGLLDGAGASAGAGYAVSEITGAGNPFDGVVVNSFTSPAFADIDNDGDLDAFVGDVRNISFFRNTGSAAAPNFVATTGAGNPFNGFTSTIPTPTFIDIDGDGDLDAFVGNDGGTVQFFRNDGNATTPSFVAVTGPDDPTIVGADGNSFDGVSGGFRSSINFADIDNDGDFDAFVGESFATVRYFRNDGTTVSPDFVEVTGTGNPFDTLPVLSNATPTFADVDNDGDLDVFVGETLGTISFYRNEGNAASASFVDVTGTSNPLDGVDVGLNAYPAFADIDNDGDFDVFVGQRGGTINFFQARLDQPITATVAAVNDAPTVTAPGAALAATEQVGLNIHGAGFSAAEVDEAGGQAIATLSVGEGTIAVTAGNSGVAITGGNNTGSVTLTGTIAQINNLLTGGGNGTIVYTNGSDTPSAMTAFTVTVNDQGNTGTDPNLTGDGNSEQSAASQMIIISAINDAPMVVAPVAALAATEQVGMNIHGAGFSVAEVDEAGGQATATLTVGDGTIAVATGTSGVTITGGNNTNAVTLTGTIAAINNLLTGGGSGTIVYSNSRDVPSAMTTFTVTVNDQGNSGTDPGFTGDANSEQSSASQTITIAAVNDAPVLVGVGNAPTLAEVGIPVLLSPAAAASDAELDALNGGNGDYSGASFVLARVGGTNANDAFSLITGGNLIVAGGPNGGGTISAGGNVIATIADVGNDDQLQITFANNGTVPTTALVSEVLRAVRFATIEPVPASVQVGVALDDGNSGGQGTGGALSVSGTVTVNVVAAINDAPTVTAPAGALAATEQVGLNIHGAGFSTAEVDEAGGQTRATLSVGEGSVAVTVGTSGVTLTGGNNSGAVTLTGTIAQINNLLTGAGTGTIVYTNGGDAPSATTTFTVTVNDLGNTGTDPGLTGDANSEEGTASQTITIAPINDAPTVVAPAAALAATEQVGFNIHGAGFTVTETDEAGGQAIAMLSVGEGTIAISVGTSGVSLTGGNNTGTVSLTGTIAEINMLLAGGGGATIIYTNTSDAPSASTTITVTVNDQGNSGTDPNLTGNATSEEGTASQAITIARINDAPTVTAPAGTLLAIENTGINIHGVGFTAAEVDEAGGQATVTLAVGEGVIAVTAGNSGVAITGGNNSGSVTLTGTIAQINNLLTGAGTGTIVYTNNNDAPSATTNFAVTVNDQGNTGSDPGLTGDGNSEQGTANLTIAITAVNDAPTLTGFDNSLTYIEGGAPVLIDGDVSVGDAEQNWDGGFVRITNRVPGDSVDVRSTGNAPGQTSVSGTDILVGGTVVATFAGGGSGNDVLITFNSSATNADVEAVIENLIYSNSTDTPAAERTIRLSLADGAGVFAIGPDYAVDELPVQNFVSFFGFASPKPTFVDIDNDGDLDLYVGGRTGLSDARVGTLDFFRNDGNADSPIFSFRGQSGGFGNWTAPAFADIDNDGDFDLFTGGSDGRILFFRNDGDATAPNFVEVSGTGNPFNGLGVGRDSHPTFADIDNDGDLDAFVGDSLGFISFFRNTGTASMPSFVAAGGADNPFDGIDVGHEAAPDFADIDNDGDLDAIVGRLFEPPILFRNDGTAGMPNLTLVSGVANPFTDIRLFRLSVPTFADIDNDGDLDVYAGPLNGPLSFFQANPNFATTANVTAVNDAPVLTGFGAAPGFTEGGSAVQLSATGSVSDVELDSPNGGNGDYSGATLVFARTGGANADDAFSLVSGGNLTIAGGPNGGGTISAGGDVIATIADVGDDDELQITFANNGTVPTRALVNEVVAAARYANTSDAPPVTAEVSVTFNDGNTAGAQGVGGALSDGGTVTVPIAAVNDAPVNDAPLTQTTDEDVDLVFSAANGNQLSISDDAAVTGVTTTLSATSGTVTVATSGSAMIGANGTGTVTITGTVAEVNAALATVIFTPVSNASAPVILTMTTNDGGNTGTGGPLDDMDSVAITVNSLNDAPTLTGLGTSAIFTEGGAAIELIPAGSVADAELDLLNGGDGDYSGATLTLARVGGANADDAFSLVSGGNLTIAGGPNGGGTVSAGGNIIATIANVGDNDELQITFSNNGTVPTTALVNEVMATVRYANTSFAPPVSAQIAVNLDDGNSTGTQGAGGAQSGGGTVTVPIADVNNAPVNTVPAVAQSTNEDTDLVFSAGNGNLLSIFDDAGTANVTTILSVTSGTLSVTTGTGTINDNMTGTVTITGTVAEVNAALAAVTFTPAANATAPVTLTMTTNDGGNSGTGGPLTDMDMVAITINPFNDAPTVTAPGAALSATEQTGLNIHGAGFSAVEVDEAGGQATATLAVGEGTIAVTSGDSGVTVTGGNVSGSVTLTGTIAEINNLLTGAGTGTIVYTNASDAPSTATTFTVTVNDQGNTGTDPGLTGNATSEQGVASQTIDIVRINDAPTVTAPAGALATTENIALAIHGAGFSATEVDEAGGQVFATLAVGEGTITVTPGASGAVVTGNDSGSVRLAGTIAQINDVLTGVGAATIFYNTNEAPSASALFTVTVNDQGNTGIDPGLTGTDTSEQTSASQTIDITAINDAPVVAVPASALAATENIDLAIHGTGFSVAEVDEAGGQATATLTVGEGAITVATGDSGVTVTGGNSTGAVTLTGSIAQINNLLTGGGTGTIVYANSSNAPSASTILTIVVNDQGNSGIDPNLTGNGNSEEGTASQTIIIAAVNDAPIVSAPGTALVATEQVGLNIHGAGFSAAEVDEGGSQATATLAVGEGTIAVAIGNSGVTITGGNNSGSVVLAGTIAQINNLLTGIGTGTIVYTNSSDTPSGTTNFTVTVNDRGSAGLDPNLTGDAISEEGVASQTIDIIAINDAPTVAAPAGAFATTENIALALQGTGFAVSEVDEAGGQATAILAVGEGAIAVIVGDSGVTVTGGNNTGAVTLTGTIAQINALLTGAGTGEIAYNTTEAPSASTLFTVTVNDRGNTGIDPNLTGTATSEEGTASQTIAITAINDAPTLSAPGAALATTEQVDLNIHGTGFSVVEVDEAGSQATATLAVGEGSIAVAVGNSGVAITGGNNSGSVVLSGTIAQINTLLTGAGTGTIVYSNSSNTPSATTMFTVTVNDRGSTGTDPNLTGNATSEEGTASQTIIVAAINDAPGVSAPGAVLAATEQVDLNIHGAGFSAAEVDEGGGQATATLAVGEGTIAVAVGNSGVMITGGNNSGAVTLTGTIAQINNLLTGAGTGTIVYTNGNDAPSASTTFAVTVNDQGNTGADPNLTGNGTSEEGTASQTITVAAVNDAPVNTIPVAQATNEDVALVFSAANGNRLAIADPDAGNGTVTTTLSVNSGTISATTNGTATINNNGSGAVTITGTVAEVNAALATITYTPTLNFNGPDVLTVTTNDGGNFGASGALADNDTVAITVNAINDAPVNTVPGPQATNEDTALTFSAANGNPLSVTDVDAGGATITTTLSVTDGSLAVTLTGPAIVTNNATGTVTIVGTVADVNAALASVVFTPTLDFNGPATLTLTTNDGGNTGAGGALVDTEMVAINVNPVNDAPINTLPPAQTTNEDTDLVFSAANGNVLSIADVDAGAANVTTTLSVTTGTLSVTTTGTAAVSNNATGTVTIVGTVAEVNAALATVTFSPPVNFNGAVRFTQTTNDGGNTGLGGVLTDTDTLAITVNPVNDGPVNSVPGSQTTDNDVALIFSAAAGNQLSIADADAGGGLVTTILTATSGTLTAASSGGAALSGNGSAALTITGTVAQVNAALQIITFTPTVGSVGTATITMTTGDNGNTGSPGALSDTDTISVEVSSGLASTGTAGGSPSATGSSGNNGQQSNFVDSPGTPIGSQGDGPVANGFFGGSNLFGRGQSADPIITAGIGGPNPWSLGVNGISESDLPGSVILDPSSDTGSSNSDGTTADSTPLLTGEAPANTIVTITSSLGGVLGTALVDANGKWSFTAPALGDGLHELIATPKDENDNEGKPSLPLLTTIDTSAPETPPAPVFDGDIDQLRDDTAPTFKGKAEPGAKIVLTSDKDGIIGEVIADENGNWQVTGDPLSQNTHAISVAATDSAGNESAPSTALQMRVAGKDTALNFEIEGVDTVDVALADGSLPFQSTDLTELLQGFVGSAGASDRFAGDGASGAREASLALGFTRQLKMAGQDRLIADLTAGV